MKKRILAAVFAALLTAQAGAVNLIIDSTPLQPDVPPTVVSGRTLVPLRAIFEALGADVAWDNATNTATATRAGKTVSISIGSQTAYVDGAARTLDVPAQMIQNRTMVPSRFVSEAFDAKVAWDGATETVYISTTGAEPVTPQTQPTQPSKPVETAPAQPAATGHKIYVTKSGKRYHYDPNCNGGTYYESTLADAQKRGLTPCQKCVK